MRKEYMNIGEMASTRASPGMYQPTPAPLAAPVFSKGRTAIDDMLVEDLQLMPQAQVMPQPQVMSPSRHQYQAVQYRDDDVQVARRPRAQVRQTSGQAECKVCSHLMFQNMVSIIVIAILIAIILVFLIRK